MIIEHLYRLELKHKCLCVLNKWTNQRNYAKWMVSHYTRLKKLQMDFRKSIM